MKRGLIVGKFMPLHRGHQFLIESALAQVDDLTVVVYDSHPEGDYPAMPAEMRARWIAALYPDLESIVIRSDIYSDDVPQAVKDSPMASQAYADDLSFLGKFDYVFSSEVYGKTFAEALGAKHISVDLARNLVPISGTKVRERLFSHRSMMDPIVYRDLVQKVVFIGTESTGKSTLAEAMADEMNTRWVHEYGRELWESQGLTGTFADSMKIATHQLRREDAAVLHSNRYLFCDTNAFTTMQWFLYSHGSVDQRLKDLVEKTKNDYIWILCKNDFPWDQDGTRELSGNKAQELQDQTVRALWGLGLRIPHYYVGGSVDERIDQVSAILKRHSFYDVGAQGGR